MCRCVQVHVLLVVLVRGRIKYDMIGKTERE